MDYITIDQLMSSDTPFKPISFVPNSWDENWKPYYTSSGISMVVEQGGKVMAVREPQRRNSITNVVEHDVNSSKRLTVKGTRNKKEIINRI
jgi:hypothetical protein